MTTRPRDDGSVSILVIGFSVVAVMLVIVGIAATSVQLGRTKLYDVADAAALDAANTLDARVYTEGIGTVVPLADRSAREAALAYVSSVPTPQGIVRWSLQGGTGAPDGNVAVVVLRGEIRIPLVTAVLHAAGGRVTVTVTSRARSDVTP